MTRENKLRKIKEQIEGRGLKNSFVAQQIGMTPQHFSSIINGRVTPANIDETVEKILDYLLGRKRIEEEVTP